MSRILVITTEPPPVAGLPATGAGIRAWALAQGLRSAKAGDVTLAFAADSVRGRAVDLSAAPWVRVVERGALDDLVASERPDAVVFQHWGIMDALRRPIPCPVAVDLAGPHLLERQLWGSRRLAEDRAQKIAALHRADFVTCSGAFQRRYFLPFLFEAGWEPRTEDPCPVIPFSMDPELPAPNAERDRNAVFFGGTFLPWQDPEAAIRATLEAMQAAGRGRLVFVGGPHPAGDVSGGRFDALLDFLQGHPLVERHGLMPFQAMVATMQRCSFMLDLMPRNAERELAFPSRTVVALWAGLPPIHNDYDELAEPLERSRAGWVLDPRNLGGLRELVGRLLARPQDAARASENARKLVAASYTWDATIAPLAAWCRDPKPREGRGPAISAAAPPAQPTPGRRRARPQPTVTYAPNAAPSGPNWKGFLLSPIVFALALPISVLLVVVFALAELAKRFVTRR
jgi:glycosyltransferase involved in cell wall biosynthesis